MVALQIIGSLLGWLAIAAAVVGCGYTLAAMVTLRRFFVDPRPAAPRREAVTLMKPLHGAEPCLVANLATFLDQDHNGPIQLLCGVGRADDPAIGAVETLRARFPAAQIDLVIDPAGLGASGKVSNLVNMSGAIEHPVVILSDSDIAVGRDYLARVLAALGETGVGAVSCLYHGRGDAGFWSRLGAMGLSYQFLPGAAFGVARGIGHPCMGSTIALRRTTLDAIGGFARFADTLADDHAIGQAVRATGARVTVPPMLVTHASADRTPEELWRHEVRWGATVRAIVPAAYLSSVVALPLPFALAGLVAHPAAGIWVVLATLALRALLARQVDRTTGQPHAWLWLPLRDLFSFAVFAASLVARSIDWRGQGLTMRGDGRITVEPESPVS